jgi:hypothetical protein
MTYIWFQNEWIELQLHPFIHLHGMMLQDVNCFAFVLINFSPYNCLVLHIKLLKSPVIISPLSYFLSLKLQNVLVLNVFII